jgi:hypothetical protein
MRYPDVGDYYGDTIISYDMGDEVITNAIFIHEFIEYTLIRSAGIPSELIDRFDTDPDSWKEYPREFNLYRRFHDMANVVEREFIENLGRDWEKHEMVINKKKIRVAAQEIEDITEEMHSSKPTEEQIESSRKAVKEAFEEEER